jgi:peroxiredoxin
MKNKSKLKPLFILALFVLMYNGLLLAQKKAVIQGVVEAAQPGDKLYLYPINDSKKRDSVILSDGKFSFTINHDSEEIYLLLMSNTRALMRLYVDDGTITIKTGNKSFSEAQVTGPAYITDYWEYYTAQKEKFGERKAGLKTMYDEARLKKDSATIVKIRSMYDELGKEETAYAEGWVKQHLASAANPFIIHTRLKYNLTYKELDALLKQLPETAKNNKLVQNMQEYTQGKKNTESGVVALPFSLPDTSNKMVSLTSFRGKYVLLDFWASWCVPCREANKHLPGIYYKYAKKGFEIISISLDKPGQKDKWLKAIQEDKLTWIHVSDLKGWDNVVGRQYGVNAIPFSLLLNKDGVIISNNPTIEELDASLKKMLGE